MRLQISRIAERGVPNQERLHLSVLQEADLAFYTVLISRYSTSGDAVASGGVSAFWFPTRKLRPGDQIILYTGEGQATSRAEANNTTTYFFYWGLKNTVWNDPSSCAVLIEAASWVTSPQGG